MMVNQTNIGDSLINRAISAFPLSIGTSLALESLFSPRLQPYDDNRVIPQHIGLGHYRECWINLGTLFRNIVGAMSKEAFLRTSEKEFLGALEQEIEVIQSLFSNEGNNLCKPVFYSCTYKHLKSSSNKAVKFREDKTEAQKLYTAKQEKIFHLLLKLTDELFTFDSEIKPTQRHKSLIMTHIPWDLVSYKNFTSLSLLESHTGKLKERHQWNTKYYPVGDCDLSILPFHRKLLLVFGDKVLIHPSDYKLRRLIVDIATRRHWTSMAGQDKMMLDFELEIKEPFVLDFLRHL